MNSFNRNKIKVLIIASSLATSAFGVAICRFVSLSKAVFAF